jgi:hypothetical protein
MERNTKFHLDNTDKGGNRKRRHRLVASRYLQNKHDEIKLMIIMARLFFLRLRRQPFLTVGLIWVVLWTIRRMKFPFEFGSIFSPKCARKFLDRLGGRSHDGNIASPPHVHGQHKDRMHQYYYSHFSTYDEPRSKSDRRRLLQQERRYS